MLPSIYKYFVIALLFFTSPLSTSSAGDYFSKLKTAVSGNDVNTVHQLLLQNSTDWLTENQGWEIAIIAAETGNLPVIQYIAERKLSILEEKNEKNKTIGHIAAEHGHPHITQYFLDKTRCDVWSPSGTKKGSLLELIAKKGYLNCLLDRESALKSHATSIGRIAAQNGHLDIACYTAMARTKQRGTSSCIDFVDIIRTAIKRSHKRDSKTLELFGKLTDEWAGRRYCPCLVELASTANNTDLIEYLAEKKCKYFLRCDAPSRYYPCRPMEIAFERNLLNQNFFDCLEKGNVNMQGYIDKETKRTVCHIAGKYGRLDVIQFAVRKNASVLEEVDGDDKKVVEIAAEKGYTDIVRYVVMEKPWTRVKTRSQVPDGWYSPKRSSTAFHLAITKNFMDMDTLKYVVEKEGRNLVTKVDSRGETVAHTAAKYGKMEILRYLLQRKPSLLSIADSYRNTVLHLLLEKNELSAEEFKFFVDMGAPLTVGDDDGATVGHIVARNGHTGFVEYLATKDPSILNIVDHKGDTVLHVLGRNNAISVSNLTFFIDRGASVTLKNKKGESFVHIAAGNGDLSIFECTLEKEPALLAKNRSVLIEALEVAARRGHSKILEYIAKKEPTILAQRPDVLFELPAPFADILKYLNTVCEGTISGDFREKVLGLILDYDYESLLHCMCYDVNVMYEKKEPLIFAAIRRKRPNILHYLFESPKTNLTALDNEGNNILFILALNFDLEKMKYVLDTLKVPIDIEWRNNEGDSLLHAAVRVFLSCFDELYDSERDSEERNSRNGQRNGTSVIKYLVEQKHADINAQGHEGKTVLHLAASCGNYHVTNYLLDHGADPKLQDANGHNFWQSMRVSI